MAPWARLIPGFTVMAAPPVAEEVPLIDGR